MISHILERVPLQQVRLLPGEHFDAQQAGARYLLDLDVDRLLYPFRREAGLPQPTDADGNPVTSYPNWEETGLDGHIAGHYLSACVGFAQVADDPQPFIDRAATVVQSWHECQQSFAGDAVMRGYVGGVPDSRTVFGRLAAGDVESQNFSMNDAWVPMYNVHKTFAGLLDTWADFASIDEQTSQLARTVVLDLADWWCRIAEPLDDETFDRILVSEFGGMCESFAELYARTGEERYHVMADRFKDHAIFDPLAQGEDVLTGMHANTQIPKVLGWERLGAICNDEQADAATNTFWDSVVHHRSVSIGAHSVSEHFHPTDDFSSMIESREGPETCNSYNMSKLAERLWLRSGSADYINFYERVLENHLLSTINPKQPGFVYFTPMRSQHYRAYSTPQECFWCCVGSGLENHARYGRLIYALQRPAAQDSADSAAAGFASSAAETGNTVSNNAEAEATRLLVNLYIDSTFDCPEQGLRITQRAARIEDGVDYTVTFTLESTAEHVPDTPGGLRETTLFLRRPWWAEHYGVMEATCAVCTLDPARTNDIPEGYLPLRLRWNGVAEVVMRLRPRITVERMPDGSPWVSFMKGPKVMALASDSDDMDGEFADAGRMSHIATGPLRPLVSMPIINGNPVKACAQVSRPYVHGLTVAATDVSGRTMLFDMHAFSSMHGCRYSVYLPVADDGNVCALRAQLADIDARQAASEQTVVDTIACGQQQSEVDHRYSGDNDMMGADGTLHWRRALAGGEFQYAMRGRGQAHRLEIEVIADSAESDGENAAYEVTLDGLPLQRGEHRRIDGDPTAIDVYPLPDAIETAETAENIENTGENDNADDAAIVRISASAHDGAKITALRLHK